MSPTTGSGGGASPAGSHKQRLCCSLQTDPGFGKAEPGRAPTAPRAGNRLGMQSPAQGSQGNNQPLLQLGLRNCLNQ